MKQLTKPLSEKELAKQLRGVNYQGLVDLRDIVPEGVDVKKFFELLEPRYEVRNGVPISIPVIRETVSTKEYDYKLSMHIVYWIAGFPYISTPKPLLNYNRLANEKIELRIGRDYLPVNHYSVLDLISINEGHYGVNNIPEFSVKVIRYVKD